MGGDRDGNPNVTSDVTRRVVALLRSRAAALYYQEVDRLILDELTHSGPISAEMQAYVDACIAGAKDDPATKPAGSKKVPRGEAKCGCEGASMALWLVPRGAVAFWLEWVG